MAEQYGMFAGTYGIAAALFSMGHTQVVVVEKDVNDAAADELYSAACAGFALNKSVIRFPASNAVAQNLPPALAETIPNLPAVKEEKTAAIICSNFACQPPIIEPAELKRALG